MANTASKDQVQADIAPVDFKGGLEIIRNRIKAKKDSVSKVNGEISGLWDQIEKKGINKDGAKLFLRLDGLEDVERRDVLRTLRKLGEEAGWNLSADMIDQVEGGGDVLEMPSRGKAKASEGGEDADPLNDAPTDDTAVDPEAKIEPATFKAAIVGRIVDESDLEQADAYVIANRIFDDMTSQQKKGLCHRLAVELADKEMEDWPGEDETKQ